MFEQFSDGYYLGRLYIASHDGPRAALHADHYRTVRRQLYRGADSDAAADRDDLPLVMRYENQHFVVNGEEEVPERTLAVPGQCIDDHDPVEPREVFLAKADRAHQLLKFAVGGDDSGDDGDTGDGGTSGGDAGGDSGGPAGAPFTPSALGDVSHPGWRPQ